MMRAALFLSPSDGYRQYASLWTIAAQSRWGIAGVFNDDSLDELRRLIARKMRTT